MKCRKPRAAKQQRQHPTRRPQAHAGFHANWPQVNPQERRWLKWEILRRSQQPEEEKQWPKLQVQQKRHQPPLKETPEKKRVAAVVEWQHRKVHQHWAEEEKGIKIVTGPVEVELAEEARRTRTEQEAELGVW